MKILIALDQSLESRHAARTAVGLLGPTGADFLVINVAPVPVARSGSSLAFGAVASLEMGALGADHEAEQRDDIEAAAAAAGIPGSDIEVVTGNPVIEICEAAERHAVDMIVVGSRNRPLLRRLLEPSVSSGVIRGSSRPVLVVSEP